MNQYKDLPAELPEKLEGWSRKMQAHFNFGRKGGAATFSVYDESEKLMPIGYQYNTCKGGLSGFSLPDVDGVWTWAQLRVKWPQWLKEHGHGA